MKAEKENKASYFSVGKEIYHYRFEIAVLNLELGVIRLNSEVQFSLSGRKRQGAVASMLFSFRQERGALMSSYTHLTHEERYQIYALKKPASLRQPQGLLWRPQRLSPQSRSSGGFRPTLGQFWDSTLLSRRLMR